MDLIYRFDSTEKTLLPQDLDIVTATEMMKQGNERFVEMLKTLNSANGEGHRDQSIVMRSCPITLGLPTSPGSVPTQAPFALVVGCSDARVPIEIVFDQFFNGMFVVRLAGNSLSTDGLGSVQYAVRTMSHSLRLGLVLGHTGCGAMTAAVDSYLAPQEYLEIGFSHPLRSILDRAMIAVRGADRAIKFSPNTSGLSNAKRRELLIEMTVYLNAAITAFQLRHEVRQLGNTEMKICYGVYDLLDGHVGSEPINPRTSKSGPKIFAEPPESHEELSSLAKGWVQQLLER
ncbi:carbonic anhydrase [Planctomicrobium sp. SH668]|uniref:carbonic anhydrase n=1 Tax=Planctomicrobium sp. SH668 TaxID=3448126 RepID=UPI003F5C879F